MTLYTEIDSCDVISFDMFDTLVVRKVATPEDVFQLVGHLSDTGDFVSIRKNAQKEAFIQMQIDGRREITLSDIYRHLPPDVGDADTLQALEEKLEIELCVVNPVMFDAFQYALKQKKRVIVTTDMYLDARTIKAILSRCGYTDYSKLYVSAEEQKTKRDSGELFQHILADMNVSPDRMLHIGDNLIGDVAMARRHGVQAHHYVEPSKAASHEDAPQWIHNSVTRSFIDGCHNGFQLQHPEDCSTEEYFWRQLGYRFAGPLHHGFLSWIAKTAKNDNIDRILFVSRDGYLLNTMYEQLFGDISHQYLYGSRTAFAAPLITADNFEDYLPLLTSGYARLSLFEFFNRFLLPLPDIDLIRECGLRGYEDIVDDVGTHVKIVTLFRRMKQIIINKAAQTREAAFAYIQDAVNNARKVAFIDIGWEASCQELFEQIVHQVNPDVEITGYYMALLDTPTLRERQKQMTLKGWLCSPGHQRTTQGLLSTHRAILELFFTAPHRSVVGFHSENGTIQPTFAPDNGNDDTQAKYVNLLNEGIQQFTKDFAAVQNEYHLPLSLGDIIRPIEQLVTKPTLEQATRIGDLYNFDGWSHTKNRIAFYAYPPTMRHILSPRYKSTWTAGLKRRLRNKPFHKWLWKNFERK
ncbi:MAG: HAD-IA family hydrolase [Deltaproteobacteria bacterium]|nr:HAD-IA family hydrolase [Deltaproteobacteria bacterium]MBN2670648.1 HAD-IA family hydrolase [Deltaproteobacteria bacterium]